MAECNYPDESRICAIIEERDKEILETNIKIKYYTDLTTKAEAEIKEIKRSMEQMAYEEKTIDDQIKNLEYIENSVKEGQLVTQQSLLHYQTLEKLMAKEVDAQELQVKQIKDECRTLYNDAILIINEHPLQKELEKARIEFLKVDIPRRMVEKEIRDRKEKNARLVEIQKQKFYNFYINMATDYVTEKKMAELENLKKRELEAIKKLYVLQEKIKNKKKMGALQDKPKSFTNIFFGSQDISTVKTAIMPEISQPKDVTQPQTMNEKLTKMFQEDEPNQEEIPQKIRIIEQRVILPIPQFSATECPIRKPVDLTKKWQNAIMRRSRVKHGISSSQQSDKDNQSPSQQSDKENSQVVVEFDSQGSMTQDSCLLKNTPCLPSTTEAIPLQYQLMTTTNEGGELMQIEPETPTFSEPTLPGGILKPRFQLDNKSKLISKPEMSPHVFMEPTKSVRFNLEKGAQSNENKGLFGAQSIFGNPFGSFFGSRITSLDEPHETSDLPNFSVIDETAACGMDFENGEIPSPEVSFKMKGEGPPENSPFGGNGGNGFFSIGNPFAFK